MFGLNIFRSVNYVISLANAYGVYIYGLYGDIILRYDAFTLFLHFGLLTILCHLFTRLCFDRRYFKITALKPTSIHVFKYALFGWYRIRKKDTYVDFGIYYVLFKNAIMYESVLQ